MIVDIAHFCLILCMFMAASQAMFGLNNMQHGDIMAKRTAIAMMALCAGAFFGLMYAYVTSDFSLINVYQNSHTQKPLIYKIAGVWGNHEGSMLLWILMLTIFGAAIALSPSIKDELLRRRALGFQGFITLGFIAFAVCVSNPFFRHLPLPLEGKSLNPLLQDMGLAFHPPALYAGYVGFSATFSLAAAGLLIKRIDQSWATAAKPFVALAWLTLSAGIALGCAWAYYELGWGGWWFWDPVENASLLPWLTGTALLHSLLVLENRGALKRWTVLLAIITFALSLLGTFLVRSGILTSVHAFAVDPARGSFILGLLTLYIGGAFALYAWRAPMLKTTRLFSPVSRETSLVANNLLLITMAATILTGTLYPLIIDTFGLAQLSVGAPFYNATIIPLAFPLIILMGIGPFLPWKRMGRGTFIPMLIRAGLITAAITLAIYIFGNPAGIFLLCLGIWLIISTPLALWGKPINLKNMAMALGHVGVGVAIIGMTSTALWKTEDFRVAKPGETYTVGGYTLRFDGVELTQGPNYVSQMGTITLPNRGGALHPEKRWYPDSKMDTTEAAIRLRPLSDLYIVLGGYDPESKDMQNWVVRTTVHPFVSFLWLGFALITASGVLTLAHSLKGRKK